MPLSLGIFEEEERKFREQAARLFQRAKEETIKRLELPKRLVQEAEPVAKEFVRGFFTLPEAGKPETFPEPGTPAAFGQAIGMFPPVGLAIGAISRAPKIARLAEEAEPLVGKIPTEIEEAVRVAKRIKLPQFAANINLAKIDAPQEVKEILVNIARDNFDFIQLQRRGVVHTKDIVAEEVANKLGMTIGKFLKTKPGKAFNAEELKVLDSMSVAKLSELKELANQIKQGQLTPSSQLQFLKSLHESIQLEAVMAGGRAEVGRGLESLKHARSALESNNLTQIQKAVEALGGRQITEEIADKLSMLDFENPAEVFKFLRSVHQPGFRQYIDGLFFNSVLSGPTTHMINSLSNALFSTVNNVLVRPTRAAVEIPIAALQGRQREYYMREVVPSLVGEAKGIPDGARRALYFMIHGFDEADIVGPEKVERLFRTEPFRGPLALLNIPSRALRAADLFFKSMNYNAELYAGAARQAAQEGLEGNTFVERVAELIDLPTQKMLEAAGEFANYTTFTTKPDKFTASVIKMRDSLPGLEFIIPFISTPSNLVKRGFEFSPVALARLPFARGAELSDAVAKMLVGTGIATTFAWMFWDGKITGGVPQGVAARDKYYRQGKVPYSVRVGDKWVQFQRLEPFNTSLTQVAALHDAFINNAEKPIQDKIFAIGSQIGENIISQTWLRGVADLIDAIREPERRAEYFISQRITSMVPSFVASIARGESPYIRQPAGYLEQVEARIPGLESHVPPKLDVFGRPIERKGMFRELFPIKWGEETQDPVDIELARLKVNVGFPTKTITTPGKKEFNLTRDGQYIFTQLAGQVIKARLDRAVANPQWQRISDAEKEKTVKKISTEERDKARNVMIQLLRREYEGRPLAIFEINERFRELGIPLNISALPVEGPLKLGEIANP